MVRNSDWERGLVVSESWEGGDKHLRDDLGASPVDAIEKEPTQQ